MPEMHQVARETPELSGKALQRARAALASRKTPTISLGRSAARAELDELIGRLGAASA
jgi:beta-N-acetylhexosaminidase